MTEFFYWTGDDGCANEPRWMVDALADGIAWLENGGTPDVHMVVDGRRFPRFSVITRAAVEAARRRGLAL